MRRIVHVLFALAVLFVTGRASAAQGVAVLGTNGARDEAFGLARAVYVTSLRPKSLDEVRAKILGGDPAPGPATKEVKDLAELRAAVNGEDAASRQILSGIAKQLDVQAIAVVTKSDADAGAGTGVLARLFLAEGADFDAARYEYDGSWQATVASIASRFPAPASQPNPVVVAAPQLPEIPPKKEDDRPFYKSPWLWGALGAAVLIGGVFFLASQDNGNDSIHVRMNVPR